MEKRTDFLGQYAKIFVSRSFALFVVFIFLFVSNYLNFYHFLSFLNTPLNAVTVFIDKAAAHLFTGKQFTQTNFDDSYWTYISLLIYLVIALLIGSIWTFVDKAQKGDKFIAYVRVFARYYLAAILLGYGISKILGNQFGRPDYAEAIYPFGNFDLYSMFWKFMGASKSYQVFGGILETLAGVLLLFRRTSTIGALITIAVLGNVLMLDLAYDTFVKIRVTYFILIAVFICAPDINRMARFFIFKEHSLLSEQPAVGGIKNYKWLHCVLKVCLIGVIIFVIVRKNNWVYAQYHYPQYGSVSGIYKIREFYLNNQLKPKDGSDSTVWDKFAVNQYFPNATVQLANDSFITFTFGVDTVRNIISLSNATAPRFKSVLHFTKGKGDEWLFTGIFKKDSIRFTCKKISGQMNIEKGYGKAIWVNDL